MQYNASPLKKILVARRRLGINLLLLHHGVLCLCPNHSLQDSDIATAVDDNDVHTREGLIADCNFLYGYLF